MEQYDGGQLANAAALLVALALFSAALWAALLALVLGAANAANRAPTGGCQRVLDGLFTLLSLASGILLASLRAFTRCQPSATSCSEVRAAAVLAFVAAALFFASLVAGCFAKAAVAASVVDLGMTTAASTTQETEASRGTNSYAALQSPSVLSRHTTTRVEGELSHDLCASDLAELRRGVRFLQFGGSLIAVINVFLGYKRYFYDSSATTAVVFAMLAAHSSTLFSGWHLFYVDVCELSAPLAISLERAAQTFFALLMLAAGFAVTLLDATDFCGDSCGGSHTAGVTFTFIVSIAYAVDLAFTFTRYQDAKVMSPLTVAATTYELQAQQETLPTVPPAVRRGASRSTPFTTSAIV